ncbi:MAG: class I SAM-dependent methyltransferase, partial [Candidatus Roizmanbacteria bacterium]
MIIQSYCCICDKETRFFSQITFGPVPFPELDGTIISLCQICGTHKTTQKPRGFDPAQSRSDMYETNIKKYEREFETIIKEVKKRCPKVGTVLDVGCSSGILLRLLKKEGYEVWGVEPNATAAKVAYKYLKGNIITGTLEKSVNKLPSRFDCIIYNHVLEHVENPLKELRLACHILKPGGFLSIGVPNRDNFIAKLRKEKWESLMPKEHIWHFRTSDLEGLFKKLDIIEVSRQFQDHKRSDYPLFKKVYFYIL